MLILPRVSEVRRLINWFVPIFVIAGLLATIEVAHAQNTLREAMKEEGDIAALTPEHPLAHRIRVAQRVRALIAPSPRSAPSGPRVNHRAINRGNIGSRAGGSSSFGIDKSRLSKGKPTKKPTKKAVKKPDGKKKSTKLVVPKLNAKAKLNTKLKTQTPAPEVKVLAKEFWPTPNPGKDSGQKDNVEVTPGVAGGTEDPAQSARDRIIEGAGSEDGGTRIITTATEVYDPAPTNDGSGSFTPVTGAQQVYDPQPVSDGGNDTTVVTIGAATIGTALVEDGDDSGQFTNADLKTSIQKQQRTLATLSKVSKLMHDSVAAAVSNTNAGNANRSDTDGTRSAPPSGSETFGQFAQLPTQVIATSVPGMMFNDAAGGSASPHDSARPPVSSDRAAGGPDSGSAPGGKSWKPDYSPGGKDFKPDVAGVDGKAPPVFGPSQGSGTPSTGSAEYAPGGKSWKPDYSPGGKDFKPDVAAVGGKAPPVFGPSQGSGTLGTGSAEYAPGGKSWKPDYSPGGKDFKPDVAAVGGKAPPVFGPSQGSGTPGTGSAEYAPGGKSWKPDYSPGGKDFKPDVAAVGGKAPPVFGPSQGPGTPGPGSAEYAPGGKSWKPDYSPGGKDFKPDLSGTGSGAPNPFMPAGDTGGGTSGNTTVVINPDGSKTETTTGPDGSTYTTTYSNKGDKVSTTVSSPGSGASGSGSGSGSGGGSSSAGKGKKGTKDTAGTGTGSSSSGSDSGSKDNKDTKDTSGSSDTGSDNGDAKDSKTETAAAEEKPKDDKTSTPGGRGCGKTMMPGQGGGCGSEPPDSFYEETGLKSQKQREQEEHDRKMKAVFDREQTGQPSPHESPDEEVPGIVTGQRPGFQAVDPITLCDSRIASCHEGNSVSLANNPGGSVFQMIGWRINPPRQ